MGDKKKKKEKNKKRKKKKGEDKLFFGCVVIKFLYGAPPFLVVAAHGNVLVFAVSFSRSSRLAVSAFLGLSCRFRFSSTPKENVSRPFFKNFVNQKKVEKSKAPLS